MDIQLGIVVGIDSNDKIKSYRVLIAKITKEAEMKYGWQFECKLMDESAILSTFSKGAKWLNVKAENCKMLGQLEKMKSRLQVDLSCLSCLR